MHCYNNIKDDKIHYINDIKTNTTFNIIILTASNYIRIENILLCQIYINQIAKTRYELSDAKQRSDLFESIHIKSAQLNGDRSHVA